MADTLSWFEYPDHRCPFPRYYSGPTEFGFYQMRGDWIDTEDNVISPEPYHLRSADGPLLDFAPGKDE